MTHREKITASAAAGLLAESIGGKAWKGIRVYLGKGYLAVGVETEQKSQVCYYLKSYDITPAVKEAVNQFNAQYEIVADDFSPDSFRDGMIARYGLSEVMDAEADVAREDWDI